MRRNDRKVLNNELYQASPSGLAFLLLSLVSCGRMFTEVIAVFKFNTTTTEEDYLIFNLFHLKKSAYGKNVWLLMRLLPLFLFVILGVTTYMECGFSYDFFADMVLLFIICGAFELLTPAFMKIVTKSHIRSLKKKGKPGYSETSVLEFCEDKFSEKAPERYAEHLYKDIERVYVYGAGYIYIYVNAQMAYVMSFDCFDSETHRSEFLAFLETKGAKAEYYK